MSGDDPCWFILGLPSGGRGVSRSDVRRAFKERALLMHPDKRTDSSVASSETSEAFITLHRAYVQALLLVTVSTTSSATTTTTTVTSSSRWEWMTMAARNVGRGVGVLMDVTRIGVALLHVPEAHLYMKLTRAESRSRAVRRCEVDVMRMNIDTRLMHATVQVLRLRLTIRNNDDDDDDDESDDGTEDTDECTTYRFQSLGHDSAVIPGHRGDVLVHVSIAR